MNYKVKKNFLKKSLAKEIYKLMSSNNFAWFYMDNIAKRDDNKRFHFTHMLVKDSQINSPHFDFIARPLIDLIPSKKFEVIRVKCNLFVRENKNYESDLHVDDHDPHKVLLYYVNSNNGYTSLKDKVKIPSVENSALFMDGGIPHRAVSQTDTKIRMNINIVYRELF